MRKSRKEQSNHYAATGTLGYTSYQPASRRARHEESIMDSAKKKRRWPKRVALLLFLAILIPALILGIWDYRNFSAASEDLFGTSNAWRALNTKSLQTDAHGRVNILIIGYSADDPGHAGALLTDSIVLMSLNPAKKTGYMLNVPRDLYVDIPNYGSAKINEAYPAGEAQKFRRSGHPSGGVGLLGQVIENTLGFEANYYAVVNYGTVRHIVDALDGVQVRIASPDPRGIFDPNFPANQGGPLKLANGVHMVDGQTALRLTRARGSTYGSYGFPQSDFNRTQNQQQVILAIQKELDWKLVLDPRTNGKIFDALGKNIKTDVEIEEALPLYRLFTSVPNSKLRSVSLHDVDDVNYLAGITTASGQSALVPAAGLGNYQDIQALLTRLNRQ